MRKSALCDGDIYYSCRSGIGQLLLYPISDQLTFIAPDLRSALCKQMGSSVLVDWTKHRLDC